MLELRLHCFHQSPRPMAFHANMPRSPHPPLPSVRSSIRSWRFSSV